MGTVTDQSLPMTDAQCQGADQTYAVHLGHKSLSALQRYIDVTEQDKEMAIAALMFRQG